MEDRHDHNMPLKKEDLEFLYEINRPFQGFGDREINRVRALRKKRDAKQDAGVIFGSNLAWSKETITPNTTAYIGPLFPDIFKNFPNIIDHLYTSFPEGKIHHEQILIGGKEVKQLEKELEKAGMNISSYAKQKMKQKEFSTQKKTEQVDLVRLTVKDLGFAQGATTDQIYQKAKELGLELCPAEVGPHYRLAYTNQPMNEWVTVAMKQISDPGGSPDVFHVNRDAGGVWLEDYWARPTDRWYPVAHFVFRFSGLRK